VEVLPLSEQVRSVQLPLMRAVGSWLAVLSPTSTTPYVAPPPADFTAFVTPGTNTADVRSVVVPSPSCP
jgi:hypothetical protein